MKGQIWKVPGRNKSPTSVKRKETDSGPRRSRVVTMNGSRETRVAGGTEGRLGWRTPQESGRTGETDVTSKGRGYKGSFERTLAI